MMMGNEHIPDRREIKTGLNKLGRDPIATVDNVYITVNNDCLR